MTLLASSMNPAISQDRQKINLSSAYAPGHPSTSTYPFASSTANTVPAGLNVASGQALNETLSQARPQYQPGYLLSLAQSQATLVTGQRHEEPLLIPTRTKMSSAYPRNAPSDFGSDSMFETTSKHRHREAVPDEDGPPSSSVVDLVSEIYTDPQRQLRNSARRSEMTQNSGINPSSSPLISYPTLYVIVFGYPPSRYSLTVAHFQSIGEGETTGVGNHSDYENAFRIGYRQPWEAARAMRWNGDSISGEGGRWMIGVKWLDPLLAEQILGPGARILSVSSAGAAAETPFTAQESTDASTDPSQFQLQHVDASQTDSAPSVGTPIKLVPSASAFRKPAPNLTGRDIPMQVFGATSNSTAKSKGMFGQVSDMIFGW